jgi:hypothetical protein
MTANQPVPPKLPITGVKPLIAVGSGKRGVGKTAGREKANRTGRWTKRKHSMCQRWPEPRELTLNVIAGELWELGELLRPASVLP